MSFETLNLDPLIMQAIAESGYTTPTEIQQQAIPVVISGRDVLASAQTGTGKTAAFILPALQALTKPGLPTEAKVKGPRILVLTPTRELAMQVSDSSRVYSKYMQKVSVVSIVGGVPYFRQRDKLKRHVDVMIATPGRLIDYLQQGKIDFTRVELLILDEADRMLDLGFRDAVEEIKQALPETRQTLLFSATIDKSIRRLAEGLLKDPVVIEITPQKTRHANIEQQIHYVKTLANKNELLSTMLSAEDVQQAIIFTATKRSAEELSQTLVDAGYSTDALHSDKRQAYRTRAINSMQNGDIRFLVATDVAARGIDVKGISHIFNYDIPRKAEDYVHRIGRTGRAGAKGMAITLAFMKEVGKIRQIENYTGHTITAFGQPAPGERGEGSGRRGGRDRGGKFGGGNRDRGGFNKRQDRGFSDDYGHSPKRARSSGHTFPTFAMEDGDRMEYSDQAARPERAAGGDRPNRSGGQRSERYSGPRNAGRNSERSSDRQDTRGRGDRKGGSDHRAPRAFAGGKRSERGDSFRPERRADSRTERPQYGARPEARQGSYDRGAPAGRPDRGGRKFTPKQADPKAPGGWQGGAAKRGPRSADSRSSAGRNSEGRGPARPFSGDKRQGGGRGGFPKAKRGPRTDGFDSQRF